MLDAIRLNWRLWTILQADLLDPECTAPSDIRANVLSLARFVDQHTVAFIAQPECEKLDVLISINREFAGGLYATQPSPEATETSAPKAGKAGPTGTASHANETGDQPSLRIAT